MEIGSRLFHAGCEGLAKKADTRQPTGMNTMKRRDFLKVTGIGAAGAATLAAPAIAQSMPELKWRLTASWPKSLDTLWGGVEHHGQARCRSHRQQVPNSGFCRRRNRAGAAGPRCRAERHRRDGTYGLLLLLRQGSDLCVRHGGAVRPQPAPQPGLVHARRRQGAAQRASTRATTSPRFWRAIPVARWAAGSARRSTPSTISRG